MYWLLAIILSVGIGYFVFLTDKKRGVPYPWLISGLRSFVVFFTLLLILVPTIVITKNFEEKPVVVLLQDNSSSIANALNSDSIIYRKNLENLIIKLSDKYKVVQWGFGNTVHADSIFVYQQPVTDISGAITRVQEFFGMQNLGAIILATDGRFNQGINPLFLQTDLHCPFYTIAIGDSALQKDLKISKAYANKLVTLNSNFEIRQDIVATLCKGYNNSLLLTEDGKTLSSLPVNINSDKYDRSFSITLKAEKVGVHHYSLSLPVAEGEKNFANNKRDIYVEVVDEKKNILIVSAAPHPDVNAIKEAISGLESYKITVCSADKLPASLSSYNAIILHGLPSANYNCSAALLAAKRPIWFILTINTNYQIINSLQSLTHTSISPAPIQNILSVYNPAFNAFLLPQQIQTITDKMPPLSANVGNILAAPGTLALFDQKISLGGGKTPVWVLQQGDVPTAILLGEGIWRWRLYEFKNFGNHNVVDECIRQTIAFLCAGNNNNPFSVALPKNVWSDQEAISIQAFFTNTNHEQINIPPASILINDGKGKKQEFSLEKTGTVYSLNIGIRAEGSYSYIANTTYNGITYKASGSFVVENVPLEQMETSADYPLLYSLSKKYNGNFFTTKNIAAVYDSILNNQQVKPIIRTNTETIPLVERKWYFFIILLIAVCEWLLRKYWLAQ